MWAVVVAAVVVLLFIILTYLYYSGLFYPVVIQVAQPYEGTVPIAYKFVISNYNQCGSVFGEFTSATSKDTTLMGIYYDNPDDPKVDKDRCRYIVGAVLTGEGAKYRDTLLSRGYSLMTVPAQQSAVFVDFPHVNYLSILIAIYRVYDAIFAYIKKQKLEQQDCMMEIYSGRNMRIIMPLEPNPGYFVPEVKKDQ